MAIDYDAWLEKPYQDMYSAQERFEEAEQEYIKSDQYSEDLGFWIEAGEKAEEYDGSDAYCEAVNAYADR
jgi:hypothetical protein